MNRKIIPFIVAIILVCLVMAVAAAFSFSGAVTAEKFGGEVAWSQAYSTAESMKVINVMGDDQDDLFIQNTHNVSIYDGNGAVMLSQDYNSPKTTLGDVNGDGMEDIIVYYLGTGASVDIISNGQTTTLATSLNIGSPARVASNWRTYSSLALVLRPDLGRSASPAIPSLRQRRCQVQMVLAVIATISATASGLCPRCSNRMAIARWHTSGCGE